MSHCAVGLLRRFPLTLPAVLFMMAGCGMFGDQTRNWEEDVLLEDGTQIRIKRHVDFSEHNSLAQDSYGSVESEATLQLQGEFSAVPVWSAPLIPLMLYRSGEKREWVIVATTSSCQIWRKRGAPNPPYWEFRLKDGAWQETTLSKEFIGADTNLFFNYHAGIPADPVTPALKQHVVPNPTGDKYLQIVASVPAEYCQS